MKVLLVRRAEVREELRENHEAGVLTGLLALAGYVNDPERLRIAVYPRDARYIQESLAWCDAVGFSATTEEYESVRRLARGIKGHEPKPALMFIGGIHVTLLGDYDRELFDFMVAGEGERVVRNLVDDRLDVVPGPGRQVFEADVPLAPGEIPLIDFRYYHDWESFRGRPPPVSLSRGCPRPTCKYCSVVGMWKKCRPLPVERAVEQIELLSRQLESVRFNVWDDTFTEDPKYIEDLLARGIRFDDASAFCRTTSELDPELLPLLKRLGVKVLLPGHESGSNRVLEYLKGRGSSVEHSKSNCLRARELDMHVLGSVMFGSPTETLEEMHETLAFMRWLIDERIVGEVWPYVAQPMPGTRFWKIAVERGKVSPDMDFDSLAFDGFDNPLLLGEEIPRERFAEVIARARALSEELREVSREAMR